MPWARPNRVRATSWRRSSSGFTIDTASDGDEGSERFAADPTGYRFVLIDLVMPRVSGVEEGTIGFFSGSPR